ncbi:MAG: hypothetical protein LQ346_000301 [Caloplaca aetnensis]|nr:MAG: hypothetical protein LQ346_000301 [Caloplaca aetnensis]
MVTSIEEDEEDVPEQNEKRFEDLKVQMEQQQLKSPLSMSMFSEDWNTSQFWYSDETAITLAEQLLDGAAAKTSIAIVSAPSVFVQLKNLLASKLEIPKLTLLEFDQRFSVFAEFVRYDFLSPIKLPEEMKGAYDRVLCDPPFLSTDCQTKAALTVRWLSKPRAPDFQTPGPRWIACTGERMEALIHKLYPGIKTTTFQPRHAQNRLSNDFRCYANFDSPIWTITE